MSRTRFVILLFAYGFACGRAPAQTCVDSAYIAARYGAVADSILRAASGDHIGFDRLAYMCDTFGPRLSGSENLERAVEWVVDAMRADGLDDAHLEEARVPHWVRGEESLDMLEPRRARLPMLGLGGSIGTPPEGITAEALVVRDFDELKKRADEAEGKIVVYDVPFTTYGESVRYRSIGAIEASRAGAVASLIRSVTPVSLRTPHTGSMRYDSAVRAIPHAAITVEDATMLQRMQDRGQRIVLSLHMEAATLPDTISHNVMAEIPGWEQPDKVVVLGGHIDSWDVGEGAVDDGGGCHAAWSAVRLLNALGLRPRRTIRVVCWTNEENGARGATAYFREHRTEVDDHVLAIESDAGVFAPEGFGFTGSDSALAVLEAVATLLHPIGAARVARGGGGVDISPLVRGGVPGLGLDVDDTKYFWYHHSPADTIDKLSLSEFQKCVAALAIVAFVVADLEPELPRPSSPSTR